MKCRDVKEGICLRDKTGKRKCNGRFSKYKKECFCPDDKLKE